MLFKKMHGESIMKKTQVRKWHKRFSERCVNTDNDDRLTTATSDEIVKNVQGISRGDRI